MNFAAYSATFWAAVVGFVAFFAVGLGIYWLFNKKARLRHLAELRAKLDELDPSDPEYGSVRALYTSLVIDAERWGFFHSFSASDSHGGGLDHSGADHGGDHSGGGGDSH
jgi:uncharacterized membrane protein YgcG